MIAIVPYELRKEKNIGRINFDQLIWIEGYPNTNDTIDSLSSKDHIIIYPSSNIWFFNYKKFNCNISLIIEEPRAVQKRYYSWLWLIRTKFHKVFVRYQCLGIKYENVTSFPIAQCWTKGVDIKDQKRKDKLISLIASNKDKLPGHKIRHQIIEQLTTINYDVIGRGYKPFKEKKDGLLPYKFSIIIENSKEDDYFSEKLIDCFSCMTIPVYWGASNIGDYFDIDGMIIFNSIKDLQDITRKLSEDLYFKMKPTLINNRKLALNYSNTAQYIIDTLSEEFN